uniref:Uncharacterized protein n=1 Tax=Anguilla anguilla TaxID=7936 RepID=A0A0E9Q2Z1_ANGAN
MWRAWKWIFYALGLYGNQCDKILRQK